MKSSSSSWMFKTNYYTEVAHRSTYTSHEWNTITTILKGVYDSQFAFDGGSTHIHPNQLDANYRTIIWFWAINADSSMYTPDTKFLKQICSLGKHRMCVLSLCLYDGFSMSILFKWSEYITIVVGSMRYILCIACLWEGTYFSKLVASKLHSNYDHLDYIQSLSHRSKLENNHVLRKNLLHRWMKVMAFGWIYRERVSWFV